METLAQHVISLGVGLSVYLTNGRSLGNLFENNCFAIQTASAEITSLLRVIQQGPARTKV